MKFFPIGKQQIQNLQFCQKFDLELKGGENWEKEKAQNLLINA